MKKSTAHLFLSLVLTTSVYAQSAKFTEGPILPEAYDVQYFKKVDDNLLVISNKKQNIKGRQLNSNTLTQTSIPNDISKRGGDSKSTHILNSKEYKYQKTITLGSRNYIFFNKFQKEDKTTSLYTQEIDNKGKMIGGPKKLGKNDRNSKKYSNDGFDMLTNKSSTILCLINQGTTEYDKKNKEREVAPVQITIFDKDLNEIANKEFETTVLGFGSSALITDEGIVYSLVYKVIDTKKEAKKVRKSGQATWFYDVYGIDAMDPKSEPFEHEINLKDKGILKATMDYQKGELICAGTYSELTKNGRIDDLDGFFYLALNAQTGEVKHETFKKLDRDIVEHLAGKRAANKNEGVSTEYKMREIVLMPNGDKDILLEEEYVIVTRTRDSKGNVTVTYHYYCNDIIVLNLKKSGDLNWVQIIDKTQKSKNDGGAYNSFTYIQNGTNLELFFGDNPKNYTKTGDFIHKKGNAVKNSYLGKGIGHVSINESGSVHRTLDGVSKDRNYYFRYASVDVPNKSIYMTGEQKISRGALYLGYVFFPYGLYLAIKYWSPKVNVAKIELAK